jgi:hypothetical protein
MASVHNDRLTHGTDKAKTALLLIDITPSTKLDFKDTKNQFSSVFGRILADSTTR